jgi:DNA-directed RNA polymerase beta subunit
LARSFSPKGSKSSGATHPAKIHNTQYGRICRKETL